LKILTFDIEDWFHILDNPGTRTISDWGKFESRIHRNMDIIHEICTKNNSKATFFVLGWIAKKYPEIVKKISDLGYEIGSHTYSHQLVFEQSQKQFSNDLERSIQLLENLTGKKVKCFRAPGFSITEKTLWAFESLIKNGIEYDCSVFSSKRAHGGMTSKIINLPCRISYKGLNIKEFPMNTHKIAGFNTVFSGGGYFRFFPYNLIKRWTKQSEYTMTYFHPRDFDFHQPILKNISNFRKFKLYYGINECKNKLERLLSEFEFTDLHMASSNIDWEKTEIINI
tara:strand:- start:591 stop:1439 length:849 start_codon:yes stop_codon:yes gene_type:complete